MMNNMKGQNCIKWNSV